MYQNLNIWIGSAFKSAQNYTLCNKNLSLAPFDVHWYRAHISERIHTYIHPYTHLLIIVESARGPPFMCLFSTWWILYFRHLYLHRIMSFAPIIIILTTFFDTKSFFPFSLSPNFTPSVCYYFEYRRTCLIWKFHFKIIWWQRTFQNIQRRRKKRSIYAMTCVRKNTF